ncbi:nicotinate-nucleotide adenylyltransferase [Lacibacterium aquatile]|uniref:Probable nicotinate-nucleotide adenylyltransferase n=1 Tax=Lacibacterium aquatile TaxID=1168082 RepID=A0ABW5DSP0_9PROT
MSASIDEMRPMETSSGAEADSALVTRISGKNKTRLHPVFLLRYLAALSASCHDGSMKRKRRIGLLGGSFNPAHDGHRHISLEALKRLDLDEIWWLVSPQNPLKQVKGMAPLAERVAYAREIALHPRLKVTDIEVRLGTRYTADTLEKLVRQYPKIDFCWLMGADNLAGFHRWQRWHSIAACVPIAVLAREPYSADARVAVAARRLWRYRLPAQAARSLVGTKLPGWVFLPIRRHPASASHLRATGRSLLHK